MLLIFSNHACQTIYCYLISFCIWLIFSLKFNFKSLIYDPVFCPISTFQFCAFLYNLNIKPFIILAVLYDVILSYLDQSPRHSAKANR